MNIARYFLCAALLALGLATLRAQTDETAAGDTAPPGATVITADELHMDQVGHTAVFSGDVVVIGSAFNMKCEEMTVYFTNDNKIDNIVAKGSVVIVQPGRITHCGQAQYFHDEDKFVLTDQPDILDNKNEIQAPEITIFRTQKSLLTKGRTKTIIIQGIGSSSAPASTGTGAQQ